MRIRFGKLEEGRINADDKLGKEAKQLILHNHPNSRTLPIAE